MIPAATAPVSAPVSIVNRDGSTHRIWLFSYAEGVPADINVEKYASLNEYVDACIHNYRERLGFVSMGTPMSNDLLDTRVESFAGWLQGHGVKKGDRVAIMLPNTFQYPVSVFATLRIGAVVVNVDPLCTPHELNHQLRDSGAETIVVMENCARTLQDALRGTSLKRIVLTQIGDLFSPGLFNLKGRALNFKARQIQKMVPAYTLPKAVWMRDALTEGAKAKVERPPVGPGDLAFLQYTRATTGLAKGAMLTHGNVVANCQQVLAFIKGRMTDEIPSVATHLPLHHLQALTVNCLVFMALGGRNTLIANPRDAQRMPSSPLLEGYGLTECSPMVTAHPVRIGRDMPAFADSIGVPLPSTEVRCRREDGSWAHIGEPGELCVRGPQVMRGYWQRWDETDKVLDRQGWLSTGEIAVMDERGFLRIQGRPV
jgi:long-chain acyl-CoA synthetase